MASLILTGIGYYLGGPLGGAIGGAIGGLIEGKPDGPDIYGPRLNDLKVQLSTYGQMIPLVYGTTRISGNIIWSTDLVEAVHESTSGGGKGGGGGESTTTTYTYSVSLAIALADMEVAAVLRCWANANLVFSGGSAANVYIYNGTELQQIDPTMEANLGAGNVPAYRGVSYVVFKNFQLEKYGNRIPNFSFEILAKASAVSNPLIKDYGGFTFANNFSSTRKLLGVRDLGSGFEIGQVDIYTGEVKIIARPAAVPNPLYTSYGLRCCYVNYHVSNEFGPVFINEIWVAAYVGDGYYDPFLVYDASSGRDKTGESFLLAPEHITDILYDEDISRVLAISANPVRANTIYVIDPYLASIGIGLTGKPEITYLRVIEKTLSCMISASEIGRMYIYNNFIVAFAGAGATAGLIIWDKFSYVQYFASESFASSGNTHVSFADVKRNCIVYITKTVAGPNTTIYLNRINLNTFTNTVSSFVTAIGFDLSGFAYYNAGTDRYVCALTGLGSTTASINPETNALEFIGDYGGAVFDLTTPFQPSYLYNTIDLNNGYALASNNRKNSYWIPLNPVGSDTLGHIITDLSLRSGLLESDIDVSTLTDIVDGYRIANISPTRASMQPLQTAYFFDAVESNNKIKFVKRGAASVASITTDEMGCYEYGQSPAVKVEVTRVQEIELPKEVNITYIDKTLDHNENTQRSQRMTGFATNIVDENLAIVMNPSKAKQVADVRLFDDWSSRNTYNIVLTRNYSHLEPTDIFDFIYNDNIQFVRILQKDESLGLIKLQCVYEDIAVYTQSGDGGAKPDLKPDIVEGLKISVGTYLDINAIKDADSYLIPSLYYYAKGVLNDFTVASLYQSIDGGASYNFIKAFDTTPAIGTTLNALPDWEHENYFGGQYYLDIILKQGSISSQTQLAILNGANIALVGNEILQFTTATLIATDTYRITGFLRARRGSDWAASAHLVGEVFAIYNATSWFKLPQASFQIGIEQFYKTVTAGAVIADTGSVSFINTANNLKCYSPTHIKGGLMADGSVQLAWIRRTKSGGEWRDLVDATLDEPPESYTVEILNNALSVVRIISGLTTPTTNYSAANIASDFPAGLNNPLLVNVYQVSSTVGRGFVGQGIVYSANSAHYQYAPQWRLYVTARDGAISLSIATLALLDDYFKQISICVGGTPTASSGTAANGFDKDNSTNWLVGTATDEDWLAYTFNSAKKIIGYAITAPASVLTSAPKSWQLQCRNNGGWQTVHSVNNSTGWAVNEKRTFIF